MTQEFWETAIMFAYVCVFAVLGFWLLHVLQGRLHDRKYRMTTAPPHYAPEKVEQVARAICRAEGADPDRLVFGEPKWHQRTNAAIAFIAAQDALDAPLPAGPVFQPVFSGPWGNKT